MRGRGLGPLVSKSSSTVLKRTGRRVVLASLGALVFFTAALRGGNCRKVELRSRVGHGVDLAWGWPEEGFCHYVVCPADVPDVAGKFGHVAEVPALAGGPGLRRLGEVSGLWSV